MIAVARTADLIVMMLDATKKEIQKYLSFHRIVCTCIVCIYVFLQSS